MRPSGERLFFPSLISRRVRAEGLKYPHLGQTYSVKAMHQRLAREQTLLGTYVRLPTCPL